MIGARLSLHVEGLVPAGAFGLPCLRSLVGLHRCLLCFDTCQIVSEGFGTLVGLTGLSLFAVFLGPAALRLSRPHDGFIADGAAANSVRESKLTVLWSRGVWAAETGSVGFAATKQVTRCIGTVSVPMM